MDMKEKREIATDLPTFCRTKSEAGSFHRTQEKKYGGL